MAGYPDPTTEDLESPEFNAIWEAIKDWDIQRLAGVGYAGADGNDVMHIIHTLREKLVKTGKPSERLGARLDAVCAEHPGREIVLEWIFDEWLVYADKKWELTRKDHNDLMIEEGWRRDGFWWTQVSNYIPRCEQFGLNSYKGRQAAMKMGTTLLSGLASMIRVFGLPPGPGTSGEINEWVRHD